MTLGVNANDEPVMKFVEGERPFGGQGAGHMHGGGGMPPAPFWEDAQEL